MAKKIYLWKVYTTALKVEDGYENYDATIVTDTDDIAKAADVFKQAYSDRLENRRISKIEACGVAYAE